MHDLRSLYRRLNREYFAAALPEVELGWSEGSSRTRFGHHDEDLGTIVINRRLDGENVPPTVVDKGQQVRPEVTVCPPGATFTEGGLLELYSGGTKKAERLITPATACVDGANEDWTEDLAGGDDGNPQTPVPNPVTHSLTARHVDSVDNRSAASNSVFYIVDQKPPAAPSNLTAREGTNAGEVFLDWSGNVETQNIVSFTVASGTGTIRLAWGDSDVSGSPCPGNPEAGAEWTIRRGSWSGPVVATGSGGCPNWSGVNDYSVLIGPTPYFVTIDWWDSYYWYGELTDFSNVYVTTPGQVTVLRY